MNKNVEYHVEHTKVLPSYLEGANDLDQSRCIVGTLGVYLTPPGSHSLGSM